MGFVQSVILFEFRIIIKREKQFVNYVITITFSDFIKIKFVLIFLLNQVLAPKQTFRINKQVQRNKLDLVNKIVLVIWIFRMIT